MSLLPPYYHLLYLPIVPLCPAYPSAALNMFVSPYMVACIPQLLSCAAAYVVDLGLKVTQAWSDCAGVRNAPSSNLGCT
jgi:hypothetical protein